MKSRFILFRRSGIYYYEDTTTKKQLSLRTKDEAEALTLLHAKNESHRAPTLNRQIARTYLAGTVATNVFLRRVHNFAIDMNWLPWPVLPKKQWPKVRFKEKRAVTLQEHAAIIGTEKNPERRAFYECCWHIGGAQSDVAALSAEDIDWRNRLVCFRRKKTGVASIIRIGTELEQVLRSLPEAGPLFPKLAPMREAHRATEFRRACRRLAIKGITLHSYRYAWAERAKTAGYPERFAQEALGHNSKASRHVNAHAVAGGTVLLWPAWVESWPRLGAVTSGVRPVLNQLTGFIPASVWSPTNGGPAHSQQLPPAPANTFP